VNESLYAYLKPAHLLTAAIVFAGMLAFALLMGIVVGPSAAEMQAGPFEEQQMEFAIERQRAADEVEWEVRAMYVPAGR
jgi:hypothetical protein